MGTDESAAQWANPVLKAPYDFKPALDHDVIVTNNNKVNAEAALGKKMEVPTIWMVQRNTQAGAENWWDGPFYWNVSKMKVNENIAQFLKYLWFSVFVCMNLYFI